MRRFGRITAAVIFASFALRSRTPPQFTVTDLGVLPGFAVSQATVLASSGAVVGYSSTANFSFEGSYAGPTGKAQGACPPVAAAPVGIADTGLVALQIAPEMNNAVYGAAWPYELAGVWKGSAVTQFLLPNPCEQIAGATGIIVGNSPNFCISNANGVSRNGQYLATDTWFRNAGYFEPTVWNNGAPMTYGQGGTAAAVNNGGAAVGVHAGNASRFNPPTAASPTWDPARRLPASIPQVGW